VAEKMREQGIKAGVVSPRLIRPWPHEQIKAALANVKAVACLDRSSPNGAFGMLYNEVAGSLYHNDTRPVITNYIYGLGGRDFTTEHAENIFKELAANAEAGKPTTPLQQFIGLRGPKLSFY
jgi:pyruvate ferredoxin oxidoreductase alpha subunit